MHQPDVRGLIATQTAVGVQQQERIAHLEVLLDAARDAAQVATARGAELEGQVLARDAQVLEDGRTIVDQRIKLEGARQIIEALRGNAVPLLYARRVDHWLASATPSAEERLRYHLTDQLARAAIAWSNGEVPLLDLQEAAHVLRAAGEP